MVNDTARRPDGLERPLAGLSAWIISDGKAGHEVQMLGIADALGVDAEVKRIAEPGRLYKLMAPFGPPPRSARFGKETGGFCPPWPALAFATGRLTTPYIRALKRKAGLQTFTVILLDPKTGPGSADLFWVPEHDRRRGPNVVTTLTSPHRFSSDRLAGLRVHVAAAIAALPRPRIAVLIGGPNGDYRYDDSDIARLGEALGRFAASGAGLMITTSRRTPAALLSAVDRATAAAPRILYTGGGDNPYADFLAHADAPLVGTYMGVAGTPEITRLVEDSDGLLLLGEIVCDTNFAVSERKIDLRRTIRALDGAVTMGFHVYPDIPLAVLVDRLLARTASRPAPPPRPVVVPKTAFPRGLPRDDAPIGPNDIATAVNDLMARHGPIPIASDIGDCLFTAMDIEPTALVAPGYYATMGFGVPAGLGLQAASGERPIVLVGDGAFQMTGWELGNAARCGFDPVVIVFNNASWGMLEVFQPESSFNAIGEWRFADAADALGGEGVRVRTRRELAEALDRAWASRGRFQLVEAMIPPGTVSSTLARFASGVKRLQGPQRA